MEYAVDHRHFPSEYSGVLVGFRLEGFAVAVNAGFLAPYKVVKIHIDRDGPLVWDRL